MFCNINFVFCIKIQNCILMGKKDLKKKVTMFATANAIKAV